MSYTQTTITFLSPLFHLHDRIEKRGHWIGVLKQDGVSFNTALFGGKDNGSFSNLPKSMRHL